MKSQICIINSKKAFSIMHCVGIMHQKKFRKDEWC